MRNSGQTAGKNADDKKGRRTPHHRTHGNTAGMRFMQDGQVFPSSTLRSSSERLLAALSADASMNDARVSLNTQLDSLPNETGERQRQFRRIHSPAELERLLAALSADASMNDARVSLNTQLDSLPNETGERQRQFRRIHSPAELARRIPLARIGFRHAPDPGDDDLYAVAKRLF